MFNWEAEDKYSELKDIQEVNNIFESYNMLQKERIAIPKNWLGRKGLQFIETLTHAEQETCNITQGLVNM